MTDLEFLAQADATLRQVELACDRACDTTDQDVDVRRVGNMLTLTFANRSEIVINLQQPLHELWLASRRGGYHYRWAPAGPPGTAPCWQNTKDPAAPDFLSQLQADALAQGDLVLVV